MTENIVTGPQRWLEVFRCPVKLYPMKAYEEIIEFFAGAMDAAKLRRYRPSKAAETRVAALVEKHKEGTLRPTEREELNVYLRLEHLMRLAKARSRKLILSA